jgi:hypothetical protein
MRQLKNAVLLLNGIFDTQENKYVMTFLPCSLFIDLGPNDLIIFKGQNSQKRMKI